MYAVVVYHNAIIFFTYFHSIHYTFKLYYSTLHQIYSIQYWLQFDTQHSALNWGYTLLKA